MWTVTNIALLMAPLVILYAILFTTKNIGEDKKNE